MVSQNPQNQPSAQLLRVLQGMIICFKLQYIEKKIFCSKLNAIFKVVKMNVGSKFGAWVSTAILQSWKFQENLERTVVVLPLLAEVHYKRFFLWKLALDFGRPKKEDLLVSFSFVYTCFQRQKNITGTWSHQVKWVWWLGQCFESF